jgi:hypothetical protein
LGCGFSSWLTRFFLAVARGDKLFQDGMPGHLADNNVGSDRGLIGFLERKKTSVYTQGGPVQFVSELAAHWAAKFGDEEEGTTDLEVLGPTTEMVPDSVFISFRREDRDTARELAQRFRDAGLEAWFDETDLNPGDAFKEKIARNIQHCFAFVPLISEHSISDDPRPWFYRFEWKKAIEAAEFRDQRSQFIMPVVVDKTDPANERIPVEFRKYQVSPIEKIDDVVAAIRKRIRELRLGGRRR